jgi:hypothetical protein
MKFNFENWNQFSTWFLLSFSLPIALIAVSLILLTLKKRKTSSYSLLHVNLITLLCYAGAFSLTFSIARYVFILQIFPAVLIATTVLLLTVLSYGKYVIKMFNA